MDIGELIAQLGGDKAEDAICDLTYIGPSIASDLYFHFSKAPSPAIRERILMVLDRFRRTYDIPFFGQALLDPNEDVWQAAIDGLVSQPCALSLRILDEAANRERSSPGPNKRRLAFLDEAVTELQKPNPFGAPDGETGP